MVNISSVPEGYVSILSGLGKATPSHMLLLPIMAEDDALIGVVEVASFHNFGKKEERFIEKVFSLVGKSFDQFQNT